MSHPVHRPQTGAEIVRNADDRVGNGGNELRPEAIAHGLHATVVDRRPGVARWLQLEVTETTVVGDDARTSDTLAALAGLGLKLAIDDFGAGATSLGWLRDLPISEVKLDKNYIRAMGASFVDTAIVRAVIDLAHRLRLAVVAEGVEDAQTWRELAHMGCDLIQGYHLCPPLPGDELGDWLDRSAPEENALPRVAISPPPGLCRWRAREPATVGDSAAFGAISLLPRGHVHAHRRPHPLVRNGGPLAGIAHLADVRAARSRSTAGMTSSMRHSKSTWRMAVVVVVLVAAGLTGPPAVAKSAGASHQDVRGGWVSPPCVLTEYDRMTGAIRCTASSTWTGTWTGVTHVEGEGTLDLATGSGSGTIEETFIGHASDGTAGTLRFTETWVADGPSMTIHIDARIVEGTGDWVGATGRVVFDGSMVGVSGYGGYVGSWTRPAR